MKSVLAIHFLAPALCLLPATAMAVTSSEHIPWWLGAVLGPVALLVSVAVGLRSTRPRAGAIAGLVFLVYGGVLVAAWVGVPGELVRHHPAGWRGPGLFEVADRASSHFWIGVQVAWVQLAIPCVLLFLMARVAGPRQEPGGPSGRVRTALGLLVSLLVVTGFGVRARHEALLRPEPFDCESVIELAPLGRQLARFDAGFEVEAGTVAHELIEMAVTRPEMAAWLEWTGRMTLSRLYRAEHVELLEGIVAELFAASGWADVDGLRTRSGVAAQRWLIALGRFSPLPAGEGWMAQRWPALETLISSQVAHATEESQVHHCMALLYRQRALWRDSGKTLERAARAVVQALESRQVRAFLVLGVCYRWPDLGERIIVEIETLALRSPEDARFAHQLLLNVTTSGALPSREDSWVGSHAGSLRAALIEAVRSGDMRAQDRRLTWWMQAAAALPASYPLLELLEVFDGWTAAGGVDAQSVLGRWLDPSVSSSIAAAPGRPPAALAPHAAVLTIGMRTGIRIVRRSTSIEIPGTDPVLLGNVLPGLADSPFLPVISVESRHDSDAVLRLELDPPPGEFLGAGPLVRRRWQLEVPLEIAVAAHRARLVVSPAVGEPDVVSAPFDLLVE